MSELTVGAIEAARGRLRGVTVRTPLLAFEGGNGADGIWIKPENLQPIGSFKLRGAFNALAQILEGGPVASVFTISTGNMSQAVAWSARRFGVPSRAIMPEDAPQTKIEGTRRYGATVEFLPRNELYLAMRDGRYGADRGFVHPFSDRRVAAGNGTVGLEILEDLADVDTVYAPLGSGGLATGIATAVKAVRPGARVIGVEPEGCSAISHAWHGKTFDPNGAATFVDGAGCPFVFDEILANVRASLDDVVTVRDPETRAAIRRLALGNKLVAEGAAALAVAAALATPASERGKTVCIVSGGGIEAGPFAEVLTERR